MGLVQKIFYFHMPSAWMFLLGGDRLRRRERALLCRRAIRARPHWRWPRRSWSCSSALLTLVTGPLWARKAWGVWWEWDARLTSSLVGWMICVRLSAPAPVRRARDRRSSRPALALFGMANVPFIYISVNFWRTIHPPTTVVPTLPVAMGIPALVLRRAFLLLFILLLRLRVRLEEQRARLDALYLALDER